MKDLPPKRALFALAMCASASLLSGCGDVQRVGNHRFHVPSENLFQKGSYPFFLPSTQDEGFIFIQNPNAPLTKRRSVLVEPRSEVCARASGSQAYVNSTICNPTAIQWAGKRWIRKGDDTFWTYNVKTSSGSLAPFVSCFKMEIPGHSGLCYARLVDRDLALTINLNADELPELERTYARVVATLNRWER